MKAQGSAAGWSVVVGILVAVCWIASTGWTQPAAKSQEEQRRERLKRASGFGAPGQTTPTPEPGAPSVSPTPASKRATAAAASRKPGASAEPFVNKAYLDAIVAAGDRATTRPIIAPEKKTLPGKIIKLNTPIEGEIYLPAGWKASGDSLAVLVHFHGAPWVVEQCAEQAGLNAVVLALNPGGLGGAYSKAFANPDVFEYILDVALQQLRKEGLAGSDARWGPLALSSFSAGYGAIREILYSAEYFNRVNGIALADSLHASLADDPTSKGQSRALNAEQMRPFVEYARLAAEGKKTLVVSRSSILPYNYSGTPETLAFLIREVGGKEEPVKPPAADKTGMTLLMKFDKGNFHARGYAGIGAADHMDHFYQMAALLAQLPLPKK